MNLGALGICQGLVSFPYVTRQFFEICFFDQDVGGASGKIERRIDVLICDGNGIKSQADDQHDDSHGNSAKQYHAYNTPGESRKNTVDFIADWFIIGVHKRPK